MNHFNICSFLKPHIMEVGGSALNKESMEIEVVDVYLNVAWAWQWEMKSQFNGDQKN